jgi:hypothetical protein
VEVVGVLSTYYCTKVIYQIREKTWIDEEGQTSSSREGMVVCPAATNLPRRRTTHLYLIGPFL